ncbi:MAG: DUF3365 domain-containing protein [Pseudomonadota bacterium]
MKIIWVSTFILISTIVLASDDTPSNMETFKQESKVQINELATTLKSRLMTAMQDGGLGEAIKVCNIEAPIITNEINTQSDVLIKRTSLKIRNPNNAPDEWEVEVLTNFQDQINEGIPISELTYSEVNEQNGIISYRMMQAIPLGGACLACHGPMESLPQVVKQELKEKYPLDQATGYTAGELRGAFSLSKTTQQ